MPVLVPPWVSGSTGRNWVFAASFPQRATAYFALTHSAAARPPPVDGRGCRWGVAVTGFRIVRGKTSSDRIAHQC